MPSSDHSVAAALALTAETLDEHRTLQAALDAIVHATASSVPEFEHVSISLRRGGGEMETRAGTSDLVWELDQVQYALGEGPCVEAMVSEPVVASTPLRHEQRWPAYVRQALGRGAQSQVGIRLFSRGRHVGGLNLYSTSHDDIAPESLETARLLATHAAIVLGHAQEVEQLNQALETRTIIGQATGIVMERFGIDAERAFAFLTRASSTGNVKLRDVALELVDPTHGRRDED